MARTFHDLDEAGRAAVATIAQRLAIMAAIVHDPRHLTNPELSRMVSEKVEASAAVGAAIVPLAGMPVMHTVRWAEDWADLCTRMSSAAASRSAQGWYRAWRRAGERMLLINAAYAAAMLGTAADAASLALTPVHRAVTANARRLTAR
jgi:hypothetical protein